MCNIFVEQDMGAEMLKNSLAMFQIKEDAGGSAEWTRDGVGIVRVKSIDEFWFRLTLT